VAEQLLAVPVIVAVLVFDGVLNTSGVTAGNEVSEACTNTGAGVPEHFGGATVEHGGGPHGKDHMILVKSAVIKESLMLLHASGKRDIIILAPAAERVEEEDGVSVASLNELLTCIFEEEHVTVVKGVTDLEAEDGISFALLHLGVNLTGEHSVFIEAIVELDSHKEAGALSGDEPITLFPEGLGTGVFPGSTAEKTGSDLLLSIVEESGLVHNGENLVRHKGALDSNSSLAGEGLLLFRSHVAGDGDGHEMGNAVLVCNSFHVHGLDELELIHETFERVCPAFRNSLEVLDGVHVKVKHGHLNCSSRFLCSGSPNHGLEDHWLVLVDDDSLLFHMCHDVSNGFFKGHIASVDIEVAILGCLIGV